MGVPWAWASSVCCPVCVVCVQQCRMWVSKIFSRMFPGCLGVQKKNVSRKWKWKMDKWMDRMVWTEGCGCLGVQDAHQDAQMPRMPFQDAFRPWMFILAVGVQEMPLAVGVQDAPLAVGVQDAVQDAGCGCPGCRRCGCPGCPRMPAPSYPGPRPRTSRDVAPNSGSRRAKNRRRKFPKSPKRISQRKYSLTA